uniref:U3 small nucleolar RNA-associated protein 25 homolog n=1 Tax=Ceriodaphnia reticulata TaxID=302197 RepID=A0A4Y7LU70_9CRUS|nr:EOG090X05RM [Ceriodaphnia reticulata]
MGRGRRGSNKRGNYRNQGSRNKLNRGSGSYKNKRGHNKVGDEKKDYSPESKRQKLELEKEKQPVIEEESFSSDSVEEVKPYVQLLSMFKSSRKAQQVLTSDEEEESEEGDEEQSEDEDNRNDDVDDEDTEEEEEEAENSLVGEDEAEDEESDMEEDQGKLEQEAVEEESEEEFLEGEEEEEPLSTTDPFSLHYGREISENLLEILTSPKPFDTQELKWKALGRMVVHLPRKVENKTEKPKPILGETVETLVIPGTAPVLKTGVPMKDYGVKLQLCANLDKRPLSDSNDSLTAEELLSPLQHELFTLANDYRDIYYPEMNHMNNDEIRTVYCLHSLNHILKSRDKVLFHNAKLKKASESGAMTGEIEYRDQGLVRPRVLIIAPLRNSAVKIVEKLADLLLPKKGQIINEKRFYDEFGEEKGEEAKKEEKKHHKPEDYEAIFTGNTDDSFRIGISVAKRTLKLYAGFYVADILIASPLGARTLLAEDFDFLCSIEVLVIDQTDILYMQNWDHVLHIFQHLHLQPREQHGTDLGRVRLWALNGYSPHYRQNLIFSSVALPEAAALFSRRGTNFAGKVRVENAVATSATTVCRVVVQLPQAFHRFPTVAAAQSADDRFHFFIKKILPQYRDALMSNTLIFIPSYYDYVRLRNFLHKEDYNFGQACEYTPDGKLAQVRNRFFLGKKRVLLYTERLHFYRRLTLKGIHNIIFYQLPTYPNFYPELCNLLQDAFQSKKYRGDSTQTCTVLYSTFDAPRLAAIVGSQRAAEMLTSDRAVHLFVSGGS